LISGIAPDAHQLLPWAQTAVPAALTVREQSEREAGMRGNPRWLAPTVIGVAAVAAVFTAQPGRANDDDMRAGRAQLVRDANGLDRMFVQLFNERRFEELGEAYYADNAIAVPPNHDPVQGRAAIVAYLRSARDAFGDIAVMDPWRASASGDLVSIVGNYAGQSGRLRATSHELFERQPDGSLKCTVDMFGFRDPLN
jgi:ketosteroid isomerase-like protein